MGGRQAWYARHSASDALTDAVDTDASNALKQAVNTDGVVALLLDATNAVPPSEFLSSGPGKLDGPGLYSWWVDEIGADDLAGGLGLPLRSGLIYAGLAGATHWPSGKPSSNTLWERIAKMHLGGNHEFSTFRRTLGAILASAAGTTSVDEAQLTKWMHEHLAVIAVPSDDADALGHLEQAVLKRLDPLFNLRGMSETAVRSRLRELRKIVS